MVNRPPALIINHYTLIINHYTLKLGLLFLILLVLLTVTQMDCQTGVGVDTIDRVAVARDSIGNNLMGSLLKMGTKPGDQVFLRAFKQEKQLEVWIKKDSTFALFRIYPICVVPGKPGPKRLEGDLQVPEGVYNIDRFNPKSNYHLSLRVNYPNAADVHWADREKPGGEIYIHGHCASVGCLPIQDARIEEVYLLTLDARNAGQQEIAVHIFPCRMTDENLRILYIAHPENRAFWRNLRPIFDFFETTHTLPAITVTSDGRYVIE